MLKSASLNFETHILVSSEKTCLTLNSSFLGNRLKGFQVRVTNDSPNPDSIDFDDKSLCYQHDGKASTEDVVTVNCKAGLPPSRYLIIRLPGQRKILQLCEVEIRKFTNGNEGLEA